MVESHSICFVMLLCNHNNSTPTSRASSFPALSAECVPDLRHLVGHRSDHLLFVGEETEAQGS